MSRVSLAIRGFPKRSIFFELDFPALMAGEQAERINPSSAVPKIPSVPIGFISSTKRGLSAKLACLVIPCTLSQKLVSLLPSIILWSSKVEEKLLYIRGNVGALLFQKMLLEIKIPPLKWLLIVPPKSNA